MQEIDATFKYKIGDIAHDGRRIGEIIRRWSKVEKVNDEKFILYKSYTIKPESGNQFKVDEDKITVLH